VNEDISILVVSCDRYRDLWQPFFTMFFRYWTTCPWPVYLGANTHRFEDKRVETILVGQDRDYSSNLLAMLDRIPTSRVLIWLEDLPPVASVSSRRLREILAFANVHRAAYVRLIDLPPYAATSQVLGLGPLPAGIRYRVSMTVAIWDTAVLRGLLRDGETAWQFEKQASRRSSTCGGDFYGVAHADRKDPPIHHVHLVAKGRLIRDATRLLDGEGIEHLLHGRLLQTRSSAAYAWAYRVAAEVSYYFRWLGVTCRSWVAAARNR
jgi:hypothetical protein